MRHLKILFILLCISFQLSAQKTIISGKALDYVAKEITFYTVPDPVLRQKYDLATTKVASDGSFSMTLSVNQTIEIYADLEKYCGTMVVEPGNNYTIMLPPFSLRTSNEAHSPYFKPAPYWLGISGKTNSDLNFAVRAFVTDFNNETVKNTELIYQNKSKEVVNGIIEQLEQKYSSNQNDYFRTLKKYYFAELEYMVNQRTPEYVIQKYFATSSIQIHHPVYQRAFETIFTDFLRKQSQNIQNRKIVNLTNSGNYIELVRFFESKGYKKNFAELVVLKGLNDGYYSGSFSKEGVVKAIEAAQNSVTIPSLQTVAQQIKNKLTLLAVGGKAPVIKLSNLNMETVTLEKFKGKFVYLLFFNSKSADCIAELDSIVPTEKRLRQVLSVVAVSLDNDFDNGLKLWKNKGYSWELLNGAKQKQLVINYNAAVTPAFYLIDPNGKFQLSPAPSPSHGFEPLFLKILRDFRYKQPRN
jgi:peroxiredoxin